MTFNYQKQYYSVAEVKNIVELETEEQSRIIAQYQEKVLELLDEVKILQSNLEVLRKKKVNKSKKRKNG
tara:strand:- start:13283 stop:13489 length:207 start_codon:yes stop_codon:yes gene_type:complete